MYTVLIILVGILLTVFAGWLFVITRRPKPKGILATQYWINKMVSTFAPTQRFTLKKLEAKGFPHDQSLDALGVMHMLGWIDIEPFSDIPEPQEGDLWEGETPAQIRTLIEKHGFKCGLMEFYNIRINERAVRCL